ncbi:hypothetical protein AB0K40_44445 [Nonomuraea bangladeshensis]|uniref:Transcriptional regulator SbtR-like C-terminal domain-containing protein n=1 Tax=Nonomuraea bangladeshensis TaxID=404385 RepID=A0ABV3HJ89_9ACTN
MQADMIRTGLVLLLDPPHDVLRPADDDQGVHQPVGEGVRVVVPQVAQQREPVGQRGGRLVPSAASTLDGAGTGGAERHGVTDLLTLVNAICLTVEHEPDAAAHADRLLTLVLTGVQPGAAPSLSQWPRRSRTRCPRDRP